MNDRLTRRVAAARDEDVAPPDESRILSDGRVEHSGSHQSFDRRYPIRRYEAPVAMTTARARISLPSDRRRMRSVPRARNVTTSRARMYLAPNSHACS